ncbi:hypothetical protein BKA70DRAFT_713307 [Coprinopsis sp. MPI-PUGE-AT-0042]|nr:hypothetical protein BKA70DRAFT_713307 [Coprinopsis sp. MPI-PUGE-AT-0042]
MNKRLTEQLTQEAERSKANLNKVAEEAQKTQDEWRQHLTDIIDITRIPQHDKDVDLEYEKYRVLQEMKITREEKLERLKRDYKIKLFQMREEELEHQITELEEDKEELLDVLKEKEQQFKDSLRQMAAKWKTASEDLKEAKKERAEIQSSYDTLREEHATLEASVATMSAKLDRLKLKYDNEVTNRTVAERANDELKRTIADLQRQLDDWQHLEKREGNEAELQRKQRVSTETELKRLKDQYDKEKKATEKDVRKLTSDSEKLQEQVDELKTCV